MSSPVLLHSSQPKTVCVQNAICLLRNLCSTFTKILCYIDKTAGYGHRRISRYQNLRPLLSDMNQQSKLHGQRFCRFESGIFVIIDGPQSKTATICCFARVARILCKSLCTQTAFGEDEVLIWFDDDCERRRLIYIDEIQSGTSLPKWRRRTFINALSSVKQPSVGCKEIYKSPAAFVSSPVF